MSLADELLADLEDAGEEVEQPDQEAPEEVPEVAEVPMAVENLQQSVRNIAKLRDSIEVTSIITHTRESVRYWSLTKVDGSASHDVPSMLCVFWAMLP